MVQEQFVGSRDVERRVGEVLGWYWRLKLLCKATWRQMASPALQRGIRSIEETRQGVNIVGQIKPLPTWFELSEAWQRMALRWGLGGT